MNEIILEKISQIENKIEALERKVDFLIDVCSDMDNSSKKMNNHINFVENVYESVRIPLDFVKTRVNNLVGNNNIEELPLLELKSLK